MKIYYTQNGLPMAVPWTAALGHEVLSLYELYFDDNTAPEQKQDALFKTIQLRSKVGDLFRLAVEDIQVTPSARSFIIQQATALDEPTAFVQPWTSWQVLLKPGENHRTYAPNWSTDERALLLRVTRPTELSRFHLAVRRRDISTYFDLTRAWLTP